MQTQALHAFAVGCLIFNDALLDLPIFQGPLSTDVGLFGKRMLSHVEPFEVVGEEHRAGGLVISDRRDPPYGDVIDIANASRLSLRQEHYLIEHFDRLDLESAATPVVGSHASWRGREQGNFTANLPWLMRQERCRIGLLL